MSFDALQSQTIEFLRGAVVFWQGGGGAMVAIAVLALFMFGIGVAAWIRLRETGYQSVPEEDWRVWIRHADSREGPIGELLDFVTESADIGDSALRFAQVRAIETKPFERDLLLMRICVSVAPLVGLLGTVMGMLSTFDALSSGSGGDKTMAAIAAGISEALITTETGLAIALPGLFFHALLSRKLQGYKVFLAHLETVCTQAFYHRDKPVATAA